MERKWQERADYGHFFYRIPNGESAADAYDRVSGFNESLWRNFNEPNFPSVCVLVTHGLMTRVFLMKWYHWSVEYFEDLRNVNHCEFVVMRQNLSNGKYLLENQLRTWSELKKKAAKDNPTANASKAVASPAIPVRKWGGCHDGCNHHHNDFPRRGRNAPNVQEMMLPPPATTTIPDAEKEDHAVAPKAPKEVTSTIPSIIKDTSKSVATSDEDHDAERPGLTATAVSDMSVAAGIRVSRDIHAHISRSSLTLPFRPGPSPYGHFGRDAGGSLSGAATPAEGLSDIDSDGGPGTYFAAVKAQKERPRPATNPSGFEGTKNASGAHGRGSEGALGGIGKKAPRRKPTEQDLEEWARESGMGAGARADPLGDEADDEEGGYLDEGGDEETFGVDLDQVTEEEKEDRSVRGSVY